MTDINALFAPQADAYFEQHPETLYTKCFYLVRDVVEDPEEKSYFGDLQFELKTVEYANPLNPGGGMITEADQRPFDGLVLELNSPQKYPTFWTPAYAKLMTPGE